jgi:polysaccharide pyruvyl transferase WcaK-like protein
MGLGIEPEAPLLVANVVNEIWAARSDLKAAVASALDALARSHGLQVAFLCHEMRDGEFFDRAAAEATRACMGRRASLVPNLYYCPDEVLGLLAHADVTLCGRYHFAVASVLAGAPPAVMARSAKMRQLVEELGLPSCGGMDSLNAEGIAEAVNALLASPEPVRAALRAARERLAARASRNLPQAFSW